MVRQWKSQDIDDWRSNVIGRDFLLSFRVQHLGRNSVAGKQCLYYIQNPRVPIGKLSYAGDLALYYHPYISYYWFCTRNGKDFVDTHTSSRVIYGTRALYQPDDPHVCHSSNTHRSKSVCWLDAGGICSKPVIHHRKEYPQNKFIVKRADLAPCHYYCSHCAVQFRQSPGSRKSRKSF